VPRVIFDPEPEYTEEARKVKHKAMCSSPVWSEQTGLSQCACAATIRFGLDHIALLFHLPCFFGVLRLRIENHSWHADSAESGP